MKQFLFVALSLIFLVSCGDDKLNTLKIEVIQLHDEVMPKMGELEELRQALKQNLPVEDSTKTDMIPAIQEAITHLEAADEGMMDWMYDYNAEAEKTMGSDEAVAYYEAEKQKIDAVKQQMLGSISEAHELLEKLGVPMDHHDHDHSNHEHHDH